MIQLESFSKSYNSISAVRSVSCSVQKGRVTGLLGANGAGKTTILKAVCAVHYPTKGSVFVDNISVCQNPLEVKKRTGYVSETAVFYPQFTVKEFLRFVSQIRCATEDDMERVISVCALEDELQKKIGNLSKGYRQRLSFAQALIHNPSVLVLDEPTSGLDPIQIQEMRKLIVSLEKEKTILLSTHLMQEVEAVCSDLIVLHRGVLVYAGSLHDVRKFTSQKTLDDAFLQLTQANFDPREILIQGVPSE